jgi:hypothetical protein
VIDKTVETEIDATAPEEWIGPKRVQQRLLFEDA